MVRRLIPIAVIAVLIGAVVFLYLPTVQTDRVDVVTSQPQDLGETDPSTWRCTGGCDLQDPVDDPTPPEPDPVPPPGGSTQAGTAYVRIAIRFVDGSEKVITGNFALLSLVIEGKEVSYITYKVDVEFEGLGEVYVTDLLYGLYLVSSSPTAAAGYNIASGGVSQPIRVPLNTRIELANMVVQASEVEQFLDSQGLPDGNYALRFWTGFFWAGTDVHIFGFEGGAASARASITGPDLPATITTATVAPPPGDGGDICFGTRSYMCIT